MSDRDDGGDAFPSPQTDGYYVGYRGMSLRDYFAAKALQGMLSFGCVAPEPDTLVTHSDVAVEAYSIADAMIAARGDKD